MILQILQQIFRQVLQLISSLKCNIYGIVDSRNPQEFRYVGKTPYSIEERLIKHIREAKSGKKTYKCDWIRKLLKENATPVAVLIDSVPLFQWIFWEKYYIKHYKDSGHRLTNATDGGEGASGYKHTKESNRKRSKSLSGNNHPHYGKTWEEMYGVEKAKKLKQDLAKRSKAGIGEKNPNYGKTWSEGMKEDQGKRMKGKNLGKKHTKERSQKISKALLGRTYEDLHGIEKANKLKKEQSERTKGKCPSDETRKLMSEVWTAEKRREQSERVKAYWKKRKLNKVV